MNGDPLFSKYGKQAKAGEVLFSAAITLLV